MKFILPRVLFAGLLALASIAPASARPANTAALALPDQTVVQAPTVRAESPWPSVASVAEGRPGPLLAHDDRYWRDGRWHYHSEDRRREEWRRAQWRREEARREAERRRDWERRHERAHHYQYDRRHYQYDRHHYRR
ncbi:hypothetical protein ACX0KM_03005 [Pseudomonas promysalinigenes]